MVSLGYLNEKCNKGKFFLNEKQTEFNTGDIYTKKREWSIEK